MALVIVIMAMLVLSAVGVALLLASSSETMMAASFEQGVEARYAAEAAVARAASDVFMTTDWSRLLGGLERSSFVDGPPYGARTLADGTSIDPGEIANLANCGRATACAAADLIVVTPSRPWGRNNPRWQPFAYGRLAAMAPATAGGSPIYLVVLVGDDPGENDDQPSRDGGVPATGEPENAGADVLVLRAEAFGPRRSYARVEATLVRTAGIVSWRLS